MNCFSNSDPELLGVIREDPTDPIPKLLLADWWEEREHADHANDYPINEEFRRDMTLWDHGRVPIG